jgi:hypothetical protein
LNEFIGLVTGAQATHEHGCSYDIAENFMRFQPTTVLAAALLVALAASPALANNGNGGNGNHYGWGAPGPIAGAGLGFLVLAGGYYVVRRWRK